MTHHFHGNHYPPYPRLKFFYKGQPEDIFSRRPFLFLIGILALFCIPATPFAFAGPDAFSKDSSVSSMVAAGPLLVKAVAGRDIQDDPAVNHIAWIKTVTRKYSPVSWDILMQYENLPQEMDGFKKGGWKVSMKKTMGTFQHLKEGNTRSDMLGSMAINIPCVILALQRFWVIRHTKEKNLLMDWEKAEAFFYLPPDKTFFVSFPIQSLFPAGVLAAEIPDSARTALFDTYIRERATTQRFGVIGLLEEFHSYYFKSKYYFDMLEAYKIAQASEAEGFLEWVRHSQSAMNAYYEFDFFILEYLLYMKKNRPSDYEALKSHRPFVEAYAAIRLSYEDLVNRYLILIRGQLEDLKASGKAQTGMEANILWVQTPESNKRKGARVLPHRDQLLPILTSSRYGSILSDFPRM